MSPCTWGVLYQSAEKPMVWTLPERPAARSAMLGGKRIGSEAPLCSRKGEVRLSDRDEGWKSALNAHIQAIFCGGTEKDGLRALANSKGVRPLPWHGWLSRRKRPWAPFPGCVFLCSISHLLFFAFCAVPGAVRVFSCTMKKWRLWQQRAAVGVFTRGQRDACPRNDD